MVGTTSSTLAIERREQVFISSTYLDLKAERQEVIQTLLEADCIPAGMELFPATDSDRWTLISREIERSDYYVVIVGGRYGSVDPATDLSYTEMEFDHAVACGIPVMGFLHGSPGEIPRDKLDMETELQKRLDLFRSKVEQRIVKYWSSAKELGGQVAKSLIRIRQTHPAEGWIRASNAVTPETYEELASLRVRVRELEADLRERQQASVQASFVSLPSGSDSFTLSYYLNYWSKTDVAEGRDQKFRERPRNYRSTLAFTWDEIFSEIGPRLLPEGPASEIESGLRELVRLGVSDQKDFPSTYAKATTEYGPTQQAIRDVTLQLKALELIMPSTRRHPISDPSTYWSLTSFGESHLVALKNPVKPLVSKKSPARKASTKKTPAKKAPAKNSSGGQTTAPKGTVRKAATTAHRTH